MQPACLSPPPWARPNRATERRCGRGTSKPRRSLVSCQDISRSQSSMPAVHSDNVWVPGQSAAPGSMSTVAAYEQIGKLCGTQTDLRCVGEHVASTWLAPTVAMHNENVAVSNLRESLKECAIPKERHDSWINTLCKYLGEPGKPAALKAPTSPPLRPSLRPQCAPTTRSTNSIVVASARSLARRAWRGCGRALTGTSSPSSRQVALACSYS